MLNGDIDVLCSSIAMVIVFRQPSSHWYISICYSVDTYLRLCYFIDEQSNGRLSQHSWLLRAL